MFLRYKTIASEILNVNLNIIKEENQTKISQILDELKKKKITIKNETKSISKWIEKLQILNPNISLDEKMKEISLKHCIYCGKQFKNYNFIVKLPCGCRLCEKEFFFKLVSKCLKIQSEFGYMYMCVCNKYYNCNNLLKLKKI